MMNAAAGGPDGDHMTERQETLTARWSFLCVVAPPRLPAGTGPPINPIAIL
jgi:hypothetical protein